MSPPEAYGRSTEVLRVPLPIGVHLVPEPLILEERLATYASACPVIAGLNQEGQMPCQPPKNGCPDGRHRLVFRQTVPPKLEVRADRVVGGSLSRCAVPGAMNIVSRGFVVTLCFSM